MSHTQETAELLALQALGWLAANEELFSIFQGASGASEADIRSGARDAAFLGSVLEFLLQDDAWVVACCDHLGCGYDALSHARAALPGGQEVNWT